jgi:putative membrane protein
MFNADYYLLAEALHIISVIAWMSGIFYLPRLYVYHADAAKGSELSETLKVMERKLLRYIMNPAMILTLIFGLWLAVTTEAWATGGWFHMKMTLVFFMFGFHGACAKWRKDFANDTNTRSAKFYRIMNEVPTVLMIGIVLLAVLKPF